MDEAVGAMNEGVEPDRRRGAAASWGVVLFGRSVGVVIGVVLFGRSVRAMGVVLLGRSW